MNLQKHPNGMVIPRTTSILHYGSSNLCLSSVQFDMTGTGQKLRVVSFLEDVMNKIKTVLVVVVSAVISFLCAFVNYAGLENYPGVVRLIAIAASALTIGACQGFFHKRPRHGAIGAGAFLGLLVLWSPVVVVTYGFALMSLPLLAIFAMLVFFGAKIGTSLRPFSCRRG